MYWKKEISQAKKNQLKSILAEEGCMIHQPGGSGQNILGVIGHKGGDRDYFLSLEGVEDVIPFQPLTSLSADK